MELFSLSCFHSNVKSVWCVTASQPLQGQTEVWFLVASITLCFIPCLRLCYIVCSEWPNFMVFWCVTIFTLEFNRHGIHTIAPKQLRFKLLGNKLLVWYCQWKLSFIKIASIWWEIRYGVEHLLFTWKSHITFYFLIFLFLFFIVFLCVITTRNKYHCYTKWTLIFIIIVIPLDSILRILEQNEVNPCCKYEYMIKDIWQAIV